MVVLCEDDLTKDKRRRESGTGVRLRNGALGLLATIALVGAAWQTWGEQRGPVSLLSIELGRTGPPTIVPEVGDKFISAEVKGLSSVRNKLGSALKPLQNIHGGKGKFAGPPAQQVRTSAYHQLFSRDM